MFTLCSRITIGDKLFAGLFQVSIKRSIHSLAATAQIAIPSRATVKEADKPVRYVRTYDEIGYMDKVVVELGYNGQYNTEFTGYVVNTGSSSTFTLVECEDAFCKMRSRTVTIDDARDMYQLALQCGLVPGMILDIPPGNFKADRQAVSTILSRVRDTYQCCVYFDEHERINICTAKRLVGSTHNYRIGWNVIDDSRLAFSDGESLKTSYRFSFRAKDGTSIELPLGAAEGKVKNIPLYDIDLPDLVRYAKAMTEDLPGAGMTGKMTAFLLPFCQPADRVTFYGKDGEQIPGSCLVEAVNVTFGPQGGRRIIDINTYGQ